MDACDSSDTPGVLLGIPNMRMKLSDLLVQKIIPEIPEIVAKLEVKIAQARENGVRSQAINQLYDRTFFSEIDCL